jgi:GNAT superfamily N-acetyltransferase
MPGYHTRPVNPDDLELICHHREAMFRDMGRPDSALLPMTAAFREWLRPRLSDGSYSGWVIEQEGVPIAGLGLIILDWPPHPAHPADTRRLYILNVYVEPEHRGNGLARDLMKLATDRARDLGIGYLSLHASDAGRPIYERLGWKAAPEMFLKLEN